MKFSNNYPTFASANAFKSYTEATRSTQGDDPTEWSGTNNRCKEPFCGVELDMNDYDDICNNCHNQVEPEEEEEETRCTLCDNDLTTEEITGQDNEDEKYCNDCFYSCCGDEIDQDTRMCPTCKEHN